MDAFERSCVNTYYEITTLAQPYMAARTNAPYGTNYDATKGFRYEVAADGQDARTALAN
ncbi:hypothetical protein GCM10010401_00880 [Rarobacter faecitabidus]|uniref:Uncharacterized protein n=1 Tax=Rarobacter faecitabidus TaxID=13243 RepID=A0A542ZWN8_RARFA|nr:hypothetical protein FB461_1292 [Rarobacter faecitabidus]